jgi:hypothetical protein
MWKEMGRKMLYTSEVCLLASIFALAPLTLNKVYNEDSPYWIDLPWEKELPNEEKEGLLMLPYNYDCKQKSSW